MSNGTNELLQSILEMDRQERVRTQETEEYRDKAMKELENTRKEITQKHQQQAEERIKAYGDQEASREQQALAALEKKSAMVEQTRKATGAAKQQQWVDEICRRVLER